MTRPKRGRYKTKGAPDTVGTPEPPERETYILTSDEIYNTFNKAHNFTAEYYTDIHGPAVRYCCDIIFTSYSITIKGDGTHCYGVRKSHNSIFKTTKPLNGHKDLEQHFKL